jgi:ribosomal-protein-alanine N-acetyltransferase
MGLTVNQRSDAGKSAEAGMGPVGTPSRALKSDLEEVQRLERETYGDDAYSYVVLRQFLDMSGELFQVYRDTNGNTIAYGIIARSVCQDSGWFLSLVVSLAHRRKGIGTELAKNLLDEARLHSLKEIFLTVAPNNETAISLYQRLGFSVMEVEHHYYGRNKGRIVMRRS